MRNFEYFLILLGVTGLLIIPITQASITTQIDIQDSFSLGESISYDYTITSDNDTDVVIIPHIECPSAPLSPIMEKTVTLVKNIPYKDIYYGMDIEDFFQTQTCTAYVQILSPVQKIEQKQFDIITDPSFQFKAYTSKDITWSDKARIFLQNENIYFGYDSDVTDVIITATLTYPNGAKKEIAIPSSMKAENIGNHEVEITASKEGYKTVTQKMQFGVIMEEAEIDYTPLTGYVPAAEETDINMDLVLIIIILIIVIVLIVALFIYQSGRKMTTHS